MTRDLSAPLGPNAEPAVVHRPPDAAAGASASAVAPRRNRHARATHHNVPAPPCVQRRVAAVPVVRVLTPTAAVADEGTSARSVVYAVRHLAGSRALRHRRPEWLAPAQAAFAPARKRHVEHSRRHTPPSGPSPSSCGVASISSGPLLDAVSAAPPRSRRRAAFNRPAACDPPQPCAGPSRRTPRPGQTPPTRLLSRRCSAAGRTLGRQRPEPLPESDT